MVEDNELMEEHQERLCELCELYILGCCSNSSTFLCEGAYCDQAVEYLKEELEEEEQKEFLTKRLLLLL